MMRQSWLFYLSSWFWPQTQVFVLLKKQTWLDAVKHEASLKHRMDSSAKWQTCFCWFASFSEITLLQFGVRAASYQRSVIATPSVWQRQARLRARARWLRTYEAASSSSSNIQSVVGYFLRGFYFWFLYFSVFLWSRLLCARVVSCLTLLSLWLLLSFEFSVLLSDCFHPFWPAVSFPVCWNLCQSKAWFVFYSIVWVCVFGSKPFTARSTSAVFNV